MAEVKEKLVVAEKARVDLQSRLMEKLVVVQEDSK